MSMRPHNDRKQDVNPRKMMKELFKVERKINQEKQQIQCACLHNKSGIMTLHGTPGSNGKTYRCTLCDKPVDIRTVKPEQFKTAVKVLDTVCDHLKIQCTGAGKSDRKLAGEIAQIQYGLCRLESFYEASNAQSNKRRERDENRQNKRRNSNGVSFI